VNVGVLAHWGLSRQKEEKMMQVTVGTIELLAYM
jgi:hypothetical protein